MVVSLPPPAIVENYVQTGNDDFDGFYDKVKTIMSQNIRSCQQARGYRSPDTDNLWLRDHVYQMQGFKYWEKDMTSLVDFFLRDQTASGSFNDLVCPSGRIGSEADVEYIAVMGAITAWQATGNDAWLFSISDILERGLTYSMTDKDRWSSQYKLVKRPFTIDTWDFQWGDGSPEINDNTRFGIMSGDNSGFYVAARALALFDTKWNSIAQNIKARANKYLWNEKRGYYKSFLHIESPVPPVNINEDEILSFSNILNVNRRDFVDQAKAQRIIEEYRQRGKWYSINPDYGENKFGSTAMKSGEYVNGGIFPFVGGELAKAELTRGYETQGVNEIKKYIELLKKDNDKTYLWYWPDGKPGLYEDTIPSDGWGSSAFLSAFIEGLAGIRDIERGFRTIELAPRWPAANINHADLRIGYGASDAYVGYTYDYGPGGISMTVSGSGNSVQAHVLLASEQEAENVFVNDAPVHFSHSSVRNSTYVDFIFNTPAHVRINIRGSTRRGFPAYQKPFLVQTLNPLSITPRPVESYAFSPSGEFARQGRTLIRTAGHEEVYYITSGKTKMHVPDEQAFATANFSFKDVWVVSPSELDTIPNDLKPFDPRMVHKKTSGNILLIVGIILVFCYAIFSRISGKTVG